MNTTHRANLNGKPLCGATGPAEISAVTFNCPAYVGEALEQDAAFIVRACNSHAELLAALETMLALEMSVTQGQEQELRAVAVPMARAAIAKATGK